MGVRETLNKHRGITVTAVVVIAAATLILGLRGACARSPGDGRAAGSAGRCFFSTDDGHSWFPDDGSKLPPIEHEGKIAYRVRVFRCPDGKEFVSHLERYAPEDKKRLEDTSSASGGGANVMVMEQTTFMQIGEVKKPGETQWVRMSPETAEQYKRIVQPKCPDGSTAGVQPVLPP